MSKDRSHKTHGLFESFQRQRRIVSKRPSREQLPYWMICLNTTQGGSSHVYLGHLSRWLKTQASTWHVSIGRIAHAVQGLTNKIW